MAKPSKEIRIRVEVVINPKVLEALAFHYGSDETATHEDFRRWADRIIQAGIEDLMDDLSKRDDE